MKSLAMVPADTEMFFALNLKMIWQMVYDVMGSSPEGRMMREAPAMQLAQQKIDLQKDIIDALTGEIAVSLPNYSKVAEAQFGGLGKDASPAASMAAMQQLKAVILLPLARRGRHRRASRQTVHRAHPLGTLERGLQGNYDSQPGRHVRVRHPRGHARRSACRMAARRVRGSSTDPAPHPSPLIRGGAGSTPLLGGSKPVFVSFTDTARVYGTAAKAIEATDPGTAKLLRLMAGWVPRGRLRLYGRTACTSAASRPTSSFDRTRRGAVPSAPRSSGLAEYLTPFVRSVSEERRGHARCPRLDWGH